MCRFLLVKTKTKTNPKTLLSQFANMAQKSKAPDGDWQGDGWGIAWIDETNNWQVSTSLKPVWEDKDTFATIPATTTFAVHARSASFPNQKGIIAYNQPYIEGQYAFVFNGLLRGVTLPNIPGNIGAEKIWYLVKKELKNRHPQEALEAVKQLLMKNSREIIALNLGLADEKNIYSLSYFTQFSDYYQLQSFKDNQKQIICSQKLE